MIDVETIAPDAGVRSPDAPPPLEAVLARSSRGPLTHAELVPADADGFEPAPPVDLAHVDLARADEEAP